MVPSCSIYDFLFVEQSQLHPTYSISPIKLQRPRLNVFWYFRITLLFHFWFFFLVSFDLYPQNISGCTPTGLMSKLSLPIPNEASQLYQPINAQWMEIEILQLQMKQITLIFILNTICSEPILKFWNKSKNSYLLVVKPFSFCNLGYLSITSSHISSKTINVIEIVDIY